MKRKIFITGGQGYLGGRISHYLNETGDYEVTISSRSPSYYQELSSIKTVKVNSKTQNLEELLIGFDALIHLAAMDAGKSFENPEEAIQVNVSDTLRWKQASEKAGVPKFIYFSTIHVYGNPELEIVNENSLPVPTHPYAITHAAAEQLVLSPLYSRKSKGYVFRLSNSFGYPLTDISQWHLVLLDFCKQAVEKSQIVIKSNALTQRDFIPISMVCRAVDYFLTEDVESGIYNLTSGYNKTLLDIATDIKKILKSKFNHHIRIAELHTRSAVLSPLFSPEKLKKSGFQKEDQYREELESLVVFCFNQFHTQ